MDMNDENQAKENLNRLRQIATDNKVFLAQVRYKLAQAIYLKNKPRVKQKIEAQELLESVSKEERIPYQFTVIALFNLCELLLDELKLYGEREVLEEVERLTQKILQIAQKQHSYTLIVQILLIRSKFVLLDGALDTADNLLKQADIYTKEKGLSFLSDEISQERSNFEKELEVWTELTQRDSPFQKRLKQAKIENYISEAMKVLDRHSV